MEIIGLDMWWHGPAWLKEDKSCWPNWNLPDISSAEIEQLLDQARQVPRVTLLTLLRMIPLSNINIFD